MDVKKMLLGIVISAMSFGAYSQTSSVVPPQPIELKVGWNLVGNSTTSSMDASKFFGDPTKVVTVWKWIAATSKWAFYAPSPSDGGQAYAVSKGYDHLRVIGPGEGFWVNAKIAFTFELPGGGIIDTPTVGESIVPGWNQVSIGDNQDARGLTHPAVASTTSIWAWDNPSSSWYFYSRTLDDNETLANYIGSKGYLDFGAKALPPGMGIWVNRPLIPEWWASAKVTPMGVKVAGANQLPVGCDSWRQKCWEEAVASGLVKIVSTSAKMEGYSRRPVVIAFYRNTTSWLGVDGLWGTLFFYADDGSSFGSEISGGSLNEIDWITGNEAGFIFHSKGSGRCYQVAWNKKDTSWYINGTGDGLPIDCPP